MDPLSIMTITAGTIKAFTQPWLNWANSKNQQATLKDEIDQIDDDLSFLEKNYSQSQLKLNTEAEQAIRNLNFNIDYTGSMRDRNANMASFGSVKKNQFAYEDLSMMIASASQAEGQAIQQAAQTGFRNTGSNQNIVNETVRRNTYSIRRNLETIKLTAAQDYFNASSNYFSASKQMEQYQQNILDTKENLKLALDSLYLEYQQKKDTLEYNKELAEQAYDDAEYEWYDGLLDFVTLGFAGAKDAVSSYYGNKQQLNSIKLQEYQIKQYERTKI